MQDTTNELRVQALKSWVGGMYYARDELVNSKTYLDIQSANQHLERARGYVAILIIDVWDDSQLTEETVEDDLYFRTIVAHDHLHGALASAILNGTNTTTAEPIDDYLKTAIGSLNSTIVNLWNITLENIRETEIEPAQQLKNAGVLTDVVNILRQIDQTSKDISTHYGS
jgi:hypothetical protein